MVIGWDIGGVNTKVALVANGRVLAACARPFELQRAPAALPPLLAALAAEVGGEFRCWERGGGVHAGLPERLGGVPQCPHAVTMTAELSQVFRTKREGIAFVTEAVERAFPQDDIRIFAADGRFLSPNDARGDPLAVAAANWAATARSIAARHRDAVLVDIGTTTTDIIPIVDGTVAARGWTDPDRLASGELVYTGALRTPVEAIVSEVPYGEGTASVSAEGFALAGDAHVWRGSFGPGDYTVATPDGRPATPDFCGERLARVICADSELIDRGSISRIADAIAAAQIARIAGAIATVVARHRSLSTAVVTGVGAFLAEAAAAAAGLTVVHLADERGPAASHHAPAASVALLLEQELAHA